jgi:hypothetical protein
MIFTCRHRHAALPTPNGARTIARGFARFA